MTVTSSLSDVEVIMALKNRKDDFGSNLYWAGQRGQWSRDQEAWAHKLAMEIVHPAPTPSANIGSMTGLIDLFNLAKAKLKYPKIRVIAKLSGEMCLSMAGPKSKYCGSIMVTDGTGFGGRYYGRIDQDGNFSGTSITPNGLIPFLAAMAADPVTVARDYGKLTGNCCFCQKRLDDERSTEMGYGPVCAKTYGLPWGK